MSFRGGGRGGRGFSGGRGSGSFGGGRGRGGGRGAFSQRDFGPPATVLEMGSFMHACEGEMVCESINPKIPQFNAQIYLQNKTSIGKVEEVLGPINQVYFTIKPSEGIQATSFKRGDKFYIAGEKLMPLERFLPKPKPPPGSVCKVKKRGGFGSGGVRGAGRGGFGGRVGASWGGRGGAPRGRGAFGGGRGAGGGFDGRGGSGHGGFSRRAGGARGRGGFSRGW